MSLNQLCSILATLAAEILNLSTVWFLRRENFNADRLELEYLCTETDPNINQVLHLVLKLSRFCY